MQEPKLRELAVLGLLAAGKSMKAVAHDLGISVRTVEGRVLRMKAKTGAKSLYHLTAIAFRKGYLS